MSDDDDSPTFRSDDQGNFFFDDMTIEALSQFIADLKSGRVQIGMGQGSVVQAPSDPQVAKALERIREKVLQDAEAEMRKRRQ